MYFDDLNIAIPSVYGEELSYLEQMKQIMDAVDDEDVRLEYLENNLNNPQSLVNVNKRIDTIEKEVDANTADISSFETSLATVQNQLKNHETRLTTLENNFKNLGNEFTIKTFQVAFSIEGSTNRVYDFDVSLLSSRPLAICGLYVSNLAIVDINGFLLNGNNLTYRLINRAATTTSGTLNISVLYARKEG